MAKRKVLSKKEVNQVARRLIASIIWGKEIPPIEGLSDKENEQVGTKIVALTEMIYDGRTASNANQIVAELLAARNQ